METEPTHFSNILLGILGLGAIAYGLACTAVWLGQTRLIFHPQPPPTLTPADLGLAYEDVWIPVNSGYVHSWWVPTTTPGAKTALVFHGNASTVEDSLRQARPLLRAGLSVLLVDYRGYGLSSGPFPNEARVYADASAAWTYLTQQRRIDPGQIILVGYSIGGAVAIDLAHRQPEAAGLILQSTFTSMADMVDVTGYGRFFPKWLLTQLFDSVAKLPDIDLPLLFIHGEADPLVPATMSQQLYALAPGAKQLWIVPDADHNTVVEVAGAQYAQQVCQWLVHAG